LLAADIFSGPVMALFTQNIRLAYGEKMLTSNILLLLAFLAVLIVFMAVKQVPQGSEWTVERFGRYVQTLSPGLHLIIPFIERVGTRISLKEAVLEIEPQDIISHDNAMVGVDAVLFYQIIDAARAAYEVEDLNKAMRNLTMTNIRTVLGALDLDAMLSQRDNINMQLLRVIDEATTPWGVKVTRVEIKEISPPRDLIDSMARQMKAEREKRALILEAEGLKQAAILKADGEKQAAILQAEGKKEASFREAEARERLAQAEASATLSVSEAIAKGSVQAINYFVAQKYIDALGKLAASSNQKVILMPLEASSVIGSVAGIAEIARQAFAKEATVVS
jgi:regulator of protease activity HflC (stomatin/prohibitin superfamily)